MRWVRVVSRTRIEKGRKRKTEQAIIACAMALMDQGRVGACDELKEGKSVAVKTMKKRIFSGSVCEQLVYNTPDGIRNSKAYDPEKPTRQRFKDEEERKRHKDRLSLNTFVRAVNHNMEPGDLYVTLTFNNEWEVHTFADARRIRKNYIRTLQRRYPDAVIFAVMGRGKGTERIHFHMLIKGIPEDEITSKWKYGNIRRVAQLRAHNRYDGVDHGADFTGIATYMWEHWTEEQGGHRWFQTKNVKQPDHETPTEVRVTGGYSEKRPPIAPKGYKLVSVKTTTYGYIYFKYVVDPQKEQRKKAKRDRGKDRPI